MAQCPCVFSRPLLCMASRSGNPSHLPAVTLCLSPDALDEAAMFTPGACSSRSLNQGEQPLSLSSAGARRAIISSLSRFSRKSCMDMMSDWLWREGREGNTVMLCCLFLYSYPHQTLRRRFSWAPCAHTCPSRTQGQQVLTSRLTLGPGSKAAADFISRGTMEISVE